MGVARRLHLVAADVGAGMNNLALQIRELDVVIVAQHELSHAGSRKVHCGGRTEPSQTYDERARAEQALLTPLADPG